MATPTTAKPSRIKRPVAPAVAQSVLLDVPGRMRVTRVDMPNGFGSMFFYSWAGGSGVCEATGEYQAGSRAITAGAEYVGSYEDDRLGTGGVEWTDTYCSPDNPSL